MARVSAFDSRTLWRCRSTPVALPVPAGHLLGASDAVTPKGST